MKTTTDKQGNALDTFTMGFLTCALWSTTDESRDDGGDPLNKNYSINDIDPTCLVGLVAECARFQLEQAETLEDYDSEQTGIDFWLTRNGHGAGFWDGDYADRDGTQLTRASKKFGEVSLYVGDDGVIYASGYETLKVQS